MLSPSGNDPLQAAYGVYFIPGEPNKYYFFQDLDQNNTFTDGGDGPDENDNEHITTYYLRGGHTIDDACTVTGSTRQCFSSSPSPLSSLRIVFRRPNPDAIVNGAARNAEIVIESHSGVRRTIRVLPTGQIEILRP